MKKINNSNNREETLRNPMNICSKNIEKLSHPDTERKLCKLTIRDGAMYLPLQVNNQTGQIMTVCNANPEATLLDTTSTLLLKADINFPNKSISFSIDSLDKKNMLDEAFSIFIDSIRQFDEQQKQKSNPTP